VGDQAERERMRAGKYLWSETDEAGVPATQNAGPSEGENLSVVAVSAGPTSRPELWKFSLAYEQINVT